jgi:hypothetical protein
MLKSLLSDWSGCFLIVILSFSPIKYIQNPIINKGAITGNNRIVKDLLRLRLEVTNLAPDSSSAIWQDKL